MFVAVGGGGVYVLAGDDERLTRAETAMVLQVKDADAAESDAAFWGTMAVTVSPVRALARMSGIPFTRN
jgi:hypothetical protein